ncbi:RCC1 and BTB domain-containing protein 1-like [Osmia bicornis bicornis]|uniref:RCC1 and BTB domain-containing protein 1-like n=1 Tax=Osmia bicornis bicornis TaxID=1437191 RepID=UPI001EAF5C6E|nr:RCC1 and BTB domain-containing protein 1-like [Osmia bicornis bicornis]
MNYHHLKHWPIFNTLEPGFLSKIHIAVVYGYSGDKALIVTNDDMVYAIGTNANGCLGTGDQRDTFNPIKIKSLCNQGIKTFSFGKDHVLALSKQGLVYSRGQNDYGQLRIGPYKPSAIPTIVRNPIRNEHITDIACGSRHFLALTNEGKVYSWGGSGNRINVPIKVEIRSGLIDEYIVSVTCGMEFNMIVTDKGKIYGWGENSEGQLGIDHYSSQKNPCKVAALDGIVIEKVVCGCVHTLALSTTGVLYAWGGNNSGQLGFGNQGDRFARPVKLVKHEMGRVLDVAASYCNDISVAMGERNVVFVWGRCLGLRIRVPTYTPLKHLHDAFAFYSSRRVTHQPLIVVGEPKEASLIDWLWNAFNDPITSDLIIKVQGEPIHVHKAILKIRCSYLRRKFDEDWDKQNQSVIEIEEFSYNVYAGFLQYLYTSEINLLVEDVAEFFNLADTYSEDELKDLCMFKLKKLITIKNVILLYNNAVEYKAKEIQEYCLNFATNRITVMLRTPGFAELDDRSYKLFVMKAVEKGAFKK